MAIYAYIRLDERKFSDDPQKKRNAENEYFRRHSEGLKPEKILIDDRGRNKEGFHDRPKLMRLLGKLSGISKGNPVNPIQLNAGDKIAVLRLSHFSDELGVQGRIVSAIGAFQPQIELIVVENGIDTSAFDPTTEDRKNFFAAFATLAKLELQDDKDEMQPAKKGRARASGPIHKMDGDGGGDGGGNGGG